MSVNGKGSGHSPVQVPPAPPRSNVSSTPSKRPCLNAAEESSEKKMKGELGPLVSEVVAERLAALDWNAMIGPSVQGAVTCSMAPIQEAMTNLDTKLSEQAIQLTTLEDRLSLRMGLLEENLADVNRETRKHDETLRDISSSNSSTAASATGVPTWLGGGPTLRESLNRASGVGSDRVSMGSGSSGAPGAPVCLGNLSTNSFGETCFKAKYKVTGGALRVICGFGKGLVLRKPAMVARLQSVVAALTYEDRQQLKDGIPIVGAKRPKTGSLALRRIDESEIWNIIKKINTMGKNVDEANACYGVWCSPDKPSPQRRSDMVVSAVNKALRQQLEGNVNAEVDVCYSTKQFFVGDHMICKLNSKLELIIDQEACGLKGVSADALKEAHKEKIQQIESY